MRKKSDKGNVIRDQVLAAIKEFWDKNGYAPSVRDLCNAVPGSVSSKAMSTSVMNYHLNVLVKQNKIKREYALSRSIRLV